MATTVPDLDEIEQEQDGSQLSNATQFEDRVHPALKTRKVFCIYTVLLGICFVMASYRPLFHTDLWGHLAYGRIISETGAIPETEPLMTLAAGQAFVDTAWLTQLMGYEMYQWAGAPGIQFFYAISITACLIMLTYAIYRRSKDWLSPMLAWIAFGWVEWQQLEIVRPQLAGLVFFMVLLTLLTSRRWHKATWVGVPLMFVLWANMHGSFPVGLGLIGAFCAGRFIDIWRHSSFKMALNNKQVQRLFLLTEICAIAVLANPYGLGIYSEVLTFSSNPNLQPLVEWHPISFGMKQGKAAFALACILIFVYRATPRRVTTVEPIVLIGLGVATLMTSRMLLWWGPVAAYYLAMHINAIRVHRNRKYLKSLDEDPFAEFHSPPAGIWSVGSAGLIWIAFATSTFGNSLVHGQVFELDKYVSNQTPIKAVAYLNENPPDGQIFNTYEWGDYILWAGKGLNVYAASHAHVLPNYIWRHYFAVVRNGANGDSMLARYGVNTILASKVYHEEFVEDVRGEMEVWYVAYEDDIAVIFKRIHPITDDPNDKGHVHVHGAGGGH